MSTPLAPVDWRAMTAPQRAQLQTLRRCEVERARTEHLTRYHLQEQAHLPRVCEECGATYSRGRDESWQQWARRRFCGRSCAAVATNQGAKLNRRWRDHAAQVIADAELLIWDGEDRERVAERMGYTRLDSLRNALRRWGRGDLAARLLAG